MAFTERHYRVVDATQALSGLPVTVADGVGVDVVVAVALLARTHRTELSHRVAEVPVLAELAPGTSPTGGALDTDRGIRVSGNFEAGAAVRAGAGLAVVGGSDQRVAVEALGAPLAVVAVGVVEAGALACDGIDTTIGWQFTVIIEVIRYKQTKTLALRFWTMNEYLSSSEV